MRRRTFLRVGGTAALAGGGATALLTGASGGDDGGGSSDASVLVAGSLQAVANRVGGGSVEAHGSVAVRRLVVEGARDPDAVALADTSLFDGIAAEYTLFASNALAVAYDPASDHAEALERDWRSALAEAEVELGRTDPDLDPLGYRTVMALELAGGVDADRVLDRSTVAPEVAVLRNLEGGALDAAFVYRNMAVEHDLPYVDLPARIDFSDPSLADHYATVSTEVGGRTVRGAPIRYGVRGFTPAGKRWASSLAGDAKRLEEAGFVVPDGCPRRIRAQTSKSGSSSGASYSDSQSM